MSDQLRALSAEIATRGSMLRTTAQAWLSRHYKMSASEAKSLIGQGSGKFFEAREDALFAAKENPTSCKCKKLEGVAAAPQARKNPVAKRNPAKPAEKVTTTTTKTVTKGAAQKKAPKRKSGGRKTAPPSTQERSPMAAKKKTARKAPKKRRTAAQEAATAAANRAKRSTKKAPKARKARKATKARRKAAKHIKTWGERMAAKKPVRRRRRRAAAPKAATAPKRRRRRTAATTTKRRAAARRRAAPRTSRATSSTTRRVRRVGNKLRTDIHTTRTTTIPRGKRNPVNDATHMTVGIVAIAVGFGSAEILDRLVVSHYPKDKDGNPIKTTDKDGKVVDMTRFVGPTALLMRHSVPNWKRFAASGGGAIVLGTSAFLLRKHSAWGTTILGGLAIGFTFKLAALGLGYVLPKMLPVKSATEDTWVNEIFPENNPAFDLGANTQAPLLAAASRITGTKGSPSSIEGAGTMWGAPTPPWKRQGSASAAAFGPVAGAGNMGRAGCKICGGDAGACKCPKARAPQANSAGNVVEIPTAANAGNVAGAPKSLADMFGKEG